MEVAPRFMAYAAYTVDTVYTVMWLKLHIWVMWLSRQITCKSLQKTIIIIINQTLAPSPVMISDNYRL